MDSTPSGNPAVLSSAEDVVSEGVFRGIVWGGFSLCSMALSGRMYIRYTVFRRLLFEDYLMIFAWAIMCASAAMCELYVGKVYLIEAVGNGMTAPPINFLDEFEHTLRAVLINNVLSLVGIWVVKFNFLCFFRRIGNQVNAYRILWWIIASITLACGAVELGILSYDCTVSDIETITGYCTTPGAIRKEYTATIISCVLDALTDLLILLFPLIILWRVRLNLRKKLILGAVFSLIVFTIAVTIIRGSIFGGVYKSFNKAIEERQSQSITWIWFWLTVEFIVGFAVACFVSFRTLFNQPNKESDFKAMQEYNHQRRIQAYKDSGSNRPPGAQSRAKRFHDSLLETCRTLEGSTRVDNDLSEELTPIPSGLLSVNFSRTDGWTQVS